MTAIDNQARLLNLLHHGIFGLTIDEYLRLKGAPDGADLDDYLTIDELRFQTRGMQLCAQLHRERGSHDFAALSDDVMDAARIVRAELLAYEAQAGKTVVTADSSDTI